MWTVGALCVGMGETGRRAGTEGYTHNVGHAVEVMYRCSEEGEQYCHFVFYLPETCLKQLNFLIGAVASNFTRT